MESELWPALENFEDDAEAIEKTLKPLLEQNLPKHASMLPLLDKAKLYIMTTYALESLLFSYLSTSSADTTEHPIMKELTRVRQYFQKIRDIESKDSEKAKESTAAQSSQRVDTRDSLVLDKAAAGRFISAALAGNDKYDVERAENIRLQKERAKEKFDGLGEGVKEPIGKRASESDSDEEEGGVRLVTGESDDETKAEASAPPGQTDGAGDVDEEFEEKKRRKKEKKRKRELEVKGGGEGKKSKKDKAKKEKPGKKK
ncbi:hypothetical protein H072_4586 [Dactylellina haptotyla CBS 200.50]|uniref:Exosome complex protein n=1 Tax=Dactylellina haptotyla (strain CBS 200.50) TaxID=1284197 RepID=S8AF53_DACHA|nr:hypothetical protein H072_4586 [Dactylellina haptotyla CBS 200.50]